MTFLNRALALLLLLVGGALVWLGGQLAVAGGSLYYLPAGLALIVTAWLLWRGSRRALAVFGALWAITLAWSLWESGASFWPLAARLGLFSGIGLWLLTPWVRRSLGAPGTTRLSGAALALAAIALVAGTGWTFWNDRIVGGTEVAALSGAPAGAQDWLHYGNDPGGTRFSPLAQIDTSNVGALTRAWTFSLGNEPSGEPAPFEATPLKVGNRLFVCSGYNDIVALDPETGRQLWRFAANASVEGVFGQTCRRSEERRVGKECA